MTALAWAAAWVLVATGAGVLVGRALRLSARRRFEGDVLAQTALHERQVAAIAPERKAS